MLFTFLWRVRKQVVSLFCVWEEEVSLVVSLREKRDILILKYLACAFSCGVERGWRKVTCTPLGQPPPAQVCSWSLLVVLKDASLQLSDAGMGGRFWHRLDTHQLVHGTRVVPPCWMLPCGSFQFSLCMDVQESYSTADKGSNSPVISQPWFPCEAIPEHILTLLTCPCFSDSPSLAFPSLCMVSAQPGGEASRKYLASKQKQPLL